MTELHLDADALARHVIRRGRDAKSLRPVGFRLDSEGINVAVTLPGPDWLSVLLDLGDVDLFRSGSVLLARPTGSDAEPHPLSLPALADALRSILAALPERSDAGEAYVDLRLAASTRSARFDAYLLDVVRAFVRTVPALPERPKAPRKRGPVKTALERKHAERERRRADERTSARWALALYLDDEAPEPGARVSGSLVYDYAEEVLSYAVERYEEVVLDPAPSDETYGMTREERRAVWREVAAEEWERPAPDRPRAVSRRVLFEVAAALGAFRITRPQGSVALTIIRRFVTRLQEAAMTAHRRASEILGTGSAEPEEFADDAVRAILDRAPTSRPEALDPRVMALPARVAFAVAGVDDDEVRSAFGLVARDHLRRRPEDRPAAVAVAVALKAGDPDGLVEQTRGRCADALLAEEVRTQDAEVSA